MGIMGLNLRDQKRARESSMKFRLTLLVVGVMAVMAAIMLSLQLWQTSHNEKQIASLVVKNVAGIEKKKLQTLIAEINKGLHLLRDWGKSGVLELDSPEALKAKLFPLFKQNPYIRGLVISSSNRKCMIFRDRTGFRVCFSDEGNQKGKALEVEECDSPEHCKKSGLDTAGELLAAASRVTHAECPNDGGNEIVWAGPFSSTLAGGVVSAATLCWDDEKSPGKKWVVGLVVNIDDMLSAVPEDQIESGAVPFLLDRDHWQVIVKDKKFSLEQGDNSSITTLDANDVMNYIISVWKERGEVPDGPVSIEWAGHKWWVAMSQVEGQYDQVRNDIMIGTLVADADMKKMFESSSSTPVSLYVAVLLVGAGVIAWIVWRYGGQGVRHGQEDRRITPERVRQIASRGEGETVEFKATMRKNLHTGKPGKEIELAWLKAVAAFMNTKGGTLLIGVDDKGNIVGTEPDGFDSDDRCALHFKNLINQHIGAEFIAFLDFSICDVDGKKVVVVDVRSSARPVFLNVGKDEFFYVRSGPSNMSLTISKALQYIESRKKELKK